MGRVSWTAKDDDTPREVYNWRLFVACICSGFGGFLFGYDNTFLGGTMALPSFKSQFGLTGIPQNQVDQLSSNIVITFQAGCLLACAFALPSAEILGRYPTLVGSSIIFIIGAAIQIVGTLNTFYAGRFLAGIGVGPLTCVVPLYLSEIAPPVIRGRCMGLFEIMFQLAGLLGFWISYGANKSIPGNSPSQWRLPVAIQVPLGAVFLIGCLTFSETPRLLVKKDRVDKGLAVLARIRGLDPGHEYVQREFANIQAEVQQERSAMGLGPGDSRWAVAKKILHDCMRKDIARRISVGVIMQFFSQMSGINGINYYSPSIFRSLGLVGTDTGLFATGIYGVVKAISSILSLTLLIDRMGRRPLLLIGAVIMIFSLTFVGVYIKINGTTAPADGGVSQASIAACAFIYIFVIGYVSSFAGIPYMLSSECVPLNVRATSATLGAAMQWLMNLVISKITPYLIASIGYGTFFFFAAWIVLGFLYVWFFVPETKSVSLEHMAKVFGQKDEVEELVREDEEKRAEAQLKAEQVERV